LIEFHTVHNMQDLKEKETKADQDQDAIDQGSQTQITRRAT